MNAPSPLKVIPPGALCACAMSLRGHCMESQMPCGSKASTRRVTRRYFELPAGLGGHACMVAAWWLSFLVAPTRLVGGGTGVVESCV